MNRRDFLNMGLISTAAVSLPVPAAMPSWRTFELNYDVELLGLSGPADLWLPLPQTLGDFQRAETPLFQSNAESSAIDRDPRDGSTLIHARCDKA